MKEETQNILITSIGVVLAMIIAIVISQLSIKEITTKQVQLEQQLKFLKDSLRVQHNYYQFTIEKDTVINQTIKIHCVK